MLKWKPRALRVKKKYIKRSACALKNDVRLKCFEGTSKSISHTSLFTYIKKEKVYLRLKLRKQKHTIQCKPAYEHVQGCPQAFSRIKTHF